MKISIVQSGGFAGITLPPKVLETDDPEIKQAAQSLSSSSSNTVYDGFTYDISIEENNTTKYVRIGDEENENLQKLLKIVL